MKMIFRMRKERDKKKYSRKEEINYAYVSEI